MIESIVFSLHVFVYFSRIEQSRKFLLDQKNYLDQKNKEMVIS